jgi:heat shock protein 90kDa beta
MTRPRPRRAVLVAALALTLGVLGTAVGSSAAADAVRPGAPTVLPPADTLIDGRQAPPPGAESFTFQAEVNRLMDIIINSLYSNRDVFLRELVSNASDALDKLRFISLTKGAEGAVEEDGLVIRVAADAEAGVLQISDTGVGMTREELITNLGTIAKSGTSSFLDRLGKAAKEAAVAKDEDAASNLIGQFGVGFYSAYLVADRVKVESRVADGAVHVWESGADGGFVVYAGDADSFAQERGTKISLTLKDDAKEYLAESKLTELIKKYSQFINFPIFLRSKTEVDVPVEETEAEAEKGTETEAEAEAEKEAEAEVDEGEKAEGDDDEIEVKDEEDEPAKTPKTRKETTLTWELMNENKPVWTRDPSAVTEEEYARFYDGICKLPGSAMARSHFKGEGEVEFRSILYIPDKPPVGLYNGNAELEKDAIRLYVRRVLVTDTFENGLLPRYLAFLVGIVDSDDLPINVSREMLQKSKTLDIIKRKLVRKALEMMRSLVKQDEEAASAEEGKGEEDKEDGDGADGADGADGTAGKAEKKSKPVRQYVKFWKLYGRSIKLGVVEDSANRARLAKLLRFRTSKSNLDDDDDFRTLDQYLDGMKEDQDHIYFHAGAGMDDMKDSPFVEKLLAKGYEVLYLTEPLDEHMIMQLPDYEGSKFMSVSKDGFKFGEKDQQEEKEKTNALKKQYRPLTKFLKKRLSAKVSKVKLSSRLSKTPCVLSTDQYGYSARMEIVMKAQAFSDPDSFSYMAPKTKVMELNPHHPLVKRMLEFVKEAEKEDGDDDARKAAEDKAVELGNLVYDTALISGGYMLHDTTDFTRRMYKWISGSVGVDPDAPVEEVVPEPADEDAPDAEQDADDILEKLQESMPEGMGGAKVMSREDIEAMQDKAAASGEQEPHDEL